MVSHPWCLFTYIPEVDILSSNKLNIKATHIHKVPVLLCQYGSAEHPYRNTALILTGYTNRYQEANSSNIRWHGGRQLELEVPITIFHLTTTTEEFCLPDHKNQLPHNPFVVGFLFRSHYDIFYIAIYQPSGNLLVSANTSSSSKRNVEYIDNLH